jgi:hypothetical protein
VAIKCSAKNYSIRWELMAREPAEEDNLAVFAVVRAASGSVLDTEPEVPRGGSSDAATVFCCSNSPKFEIVG